MYMATKHEPVRNGDDPNESRIQTYSGMYYNYEEPTPDMILLIDIAHQLAGTYRFSAATEPWISVAEHSVAVSRLADEADRKEALMHDGAEAYLWDIPKPAKRLYGKVYEELTEKCDAAIAERFDLDVVKLQEKPFHDADFVMLNYEGNIGLKHWSEPLPEIPESVINWTIGLPPAEAKQLFLAEAVRVGLSTKVDYAPSLPQLKGH